MAGAAPNEKMVGKTPTLVICFFKATDIILLMFTQIG